MRTLPVSAFSRTPWGTKNLQLLHELVPQVAVVAMLVNPASPNSGPDTADAQSAARILGLRLLVLQASDQSGIEAAFATLVQQQVGALLVGADPFFAASSQQLATLAARHRVPAIYNRREFAVAGGLMSYGTNFVDAYAPSRAVTPAEFSRAKSPPTCRSCSPQSLNW